MKLIFSYFKGNTTMTQQTQPSFFQSYVIKPLRVIFTPIGHLFSGVSKLIGSITNAIDPNDLGKTFDSLSEKFDKTVDLITKVKQQVRDAKEKIKNADKANKTELDASVLKSNINDAVSDADGIWLNDDPSLGSLQRIQSSLNGKTKLNADEVADVFDQLMSAKKNSFYSSTSTAIDKAMKASRDLLKDNAVLLNNK